MWLAVVLTMLISLIFGFALGFFFPQIRRCLQRLYHHNHSDDPDAFLEYKQAFEKPSSAPDNRWDKNNRESSNNLNTNNTSSLTSSSHNTNIYQPAPSTATDTGFMTAGRLLPGKQLNTIVNPLNAQSSARTPNGQADTKIVSPKGKTYL